MLILPPLKYNYIYIENEFSGRPEKAFTGTIIKRFGTASNGIMYHYCIILGTDTKGNILIIHNDSNGVEIQTFDKWNENWGSNWSVEYYNRDESSIPDIISRTTEVSDKHFHNRLNNCEHFANYAVFGQEFRDSLQSLFSEITQKLLFIGFDIQVETGSEALQKRYNKFKRNIFKPKSRIQLKLNSTPIINR